MAVQKKQIEMYQLKITKYEGRSIPIEHIDINEELNKILTYSVSLPTIDRKKDFKSDKKILYIDSFTFDEVNNIYNIVIASAKYNHRRQVIDTATLQEKGVLKEALDGDIEYNYLSIRCLNDSIALTAYANNYYGVALSKVLKYFDDMANKYYKEVNIRRFYHFEYDIVVEQDFLLKMTQMEKINAIKVTVAKELVSSSEFIEVSGIKEIKDEVEICFKPVKGNSLGFLTARNFFNKKLNNPAIKRMVIDGKIEGMSTSIDTEKLKQKHIIEVEERFDGSLKLTEIFNKLKEFVGVE